MTRYLSALLRQWRSRRGPRRCLARIGWARSAESRQLVPILCGAYLGKWLWLWHGTCWCHRRPGSLDIYDQQGSTR